MKKGKMKRIKRITCIISALLLLFSFTGCSLLDDEFWEDEYEDDEYGGIGEYTDGPLEWAPSSSVLSVDKNTGEMTIKRPGRESETPMGEDGTWTIFVYLCGSDLESENGMGTDDLTEMMSAEIGDNIRFVVQTGGAYDWYNEDVDKDKLQRFLIQNQKMVEVYSAEAGDMGDTAVLTDFLRWGVKEYPANHMGVILWNHGGGSIEGVCYDENNEEDSLTLPEIDAAFYSVAPEMTDRFEFVGFDACLMGTVETIIPQQMYWLLMPDICTAPKKRNRAAAGTIRPSETIFPRILRRTERNSAKWFAILIWKPAVWMRMPILLHYP